MKIEPIGVIKSPFSRPEGTPIQPALAEGAEGEVVLESAYAPALADLDGFERIWLIYWLDRAPAFRPKVTPFLDDTERGLFATRAPCRPNPIGLSVVRLLEVNGHVLRIADVDILDGTPLLDIKPYAPRFDAHPDSQPGWLGGAGPASRADDRFA